VGCLSFSDGTGVGTLTQHNREGAAGVQLPITGGGEDCGERTAPVFFYEGT
jgi:hypothetical protein